MSACPEAEIVFEDVCFAYGEGPNALDGTSLSIEKGEFVAVLGANGSGKSTLAKHVNALFIPSSGTVRVGGLDTSDPQNVFDIRRRAGMVFQNPDNQAVASVVADDVAFGPENLGLPPAEIRERVDRALASVAMQKFASEDIFNLSGGQKQRIAIAGVLAMAPELLILDEPGAMLDPRGRRGILRVAHELNESGLTVVLITHFMADALNADHIIVLDEGRVALEGTPQEVFTNAERLRSLRLELPFSLQLAEDLEAAGVHVGSGLDEAQLQDELVSLAGETAGDSAVPAGEIVGARFIAPAKTPEPCPKNAPAIVFDHVTYAYDDEHTALSDIDISVERGSFVGLVGHTGSGKSTLTQLMDALLVPTKGRVIVNGLDTADRANRRDIRRNVGLAFQYPETQLFAATVAEDVAFGPRNLGLSDDEVERRCREALARVGFEYDDVAERSPFDLSGGQKRRVALAGILAMEPETLVLDEPAAGMDPATNAEIRELLRSFHADGMTIILVSHSMEEVAELCDRVIVLDGGCVVHDGAPAQVFSRENAVELRRINLGVPRATKFAIELAEKGLDLGEGILDEPELARRLVDALQA